MVLGIAHGDQADDDDDLATQIAAFEAGVIRSALSSAEGDVALVQTRLGLPRNAHYDRLNRFDIKLADCRHTP